MKSCLIGTFFTLILLSFSANASLVDFPVCGGAAVDCLITSTPPNPVTSDPNDGILLAWNEVQNFTLTDNLYVDRVFDETAPFVGRDSSGLYLKAGTVVSSHYVQWDPLGTPTSIVRVEATIRTDSQIFSFITSDQNLFDSDVFLGLPGLDYNDFTNRGLEASNNDITNFNGNSVDIDWGASSPGDWTRMVTAFSPGAVVPIPAAAWLFGTGLLGLVGMARRKKSA